MGTVPTSGKRESGPGGSDPSKQVFVKNCPKGWSHLELFEHFKEIGEISSAKVSITAEFESRCYGFVEFASVEAARRAVAEMDGKEVEVVSDDPPSGDEGSGESDTKKERETVNLAVSGFEPKR